MSYGPLQRAQAWAVTGPLGHFWSASADVVLLWSRYLWSRARRRQSRRDLAPPP